MPHHMQIKCKRIVRKTEKSADKGVFLITRERKRKRRALYAF